MVTKTKIMRLSNPGIALRLCCFMQPGDAQSVRILLGEARQALQYEQNMADIYAKSGKQSDINTATAIRELVTTWEAVIAQGEKLLARLLSV